MRGENVRHSKAFIAKQAARMQRAEEIIGAGHQTVRSMASNLLVSLVTARKILDGMLAENKAYTWMQPAQPGHSPMRFYAAGTRSRGEKLQQIIRHLSVDPLSMKELCLVMGCGTMTAHRALMELKAQNRVHVARWTPVGRNYEQLWIAGAGEDAATAYQSCFAQQTPEYLGKVVRWYYSTQAPGPIVYASNGNTVSLSYGARPCMTLPDEFPDDIDYAWYVGKAEAMLKDIGFYALT